MMPTPRFQTLFRCIPPSLAVVVAASLALPAAAPARPDVAAPPAAGAAAPRDAAVDVPSPQTPEAPVEEPVRQVRRGRRSVAVPEGGRSILLANGFRFDPLRDGEPPLRAPLSAVPDPGGVGGFLVQLHGPAGDSVREAIESAGALVVGYVPENTYLVRMTSRTRATVESLSFVRWVGRHHPAYKRSNNLARAAASGPADLVVLLYPDADLDAARQEIAAAGAEIVEATDSGRSKVLRVRTDAALADVFAAREDVAWVEPRYELRLTNDLAQWTVQTNVSGDRRVWDMGIQGQGQIVHTSDSGIRTTHNQFRDDLVPITTWGDYPSHRKIIAYQPTVVGQVLFGDVAAASYHGTHTAGTLMGDDSPFATDPRDGMALKARIWFHDGGADANTIASPTDLNLLFGEAYTGNAAGGARISSNSWSAATNGEYTVLDMTADQFLHDHRDMLIFFSTGNDGAPATVGSPATCKNAVGSGATQNGSLSNLMMPLTSQGPTQDGRTKPTLVSPGMSIVSANGANDAGYQSLTGTSMSSPSKAGATTLIRQYFTDGWYPTGSTVPGNALTPSGALLKAAAISSTDNDMTGYNVPNTTTGWGRINVDNILYFPGDSRRLAVIDEPNGLATGEFVEYEVHVSDPAVPLKITLCWTDKEGTPGALTQLVNDLDLSVTDPSALTYLGNVLAAGESVPGGVPDLLNVEEGVRKALPAAGIWTIRVDGSSVPFGPQPFAIAVSGGIGVDAGILRIDRLTYGRDDVIDVRVEDANAASPITVALSSGSESPPEVVSVPGANGVFTASVPTTASEMFNGDGKLSVSHGDVITVVYADASPVAQVTATATADFTGPVITNVRSAAQSASQAVTWDTDALATARVHFGTTPALGQTSALDPTLRTRHEIRLSGLLPETGYWFDVESADHAGNVTRDDAGGGHYRFTTAANGDILLVVGDGSFTNVDTYLDAFEATGWDASVLSGGTIGDPSVGDAAAGLRSYTAVWWQVGLEQYPPFEDQARDSLSRYLDGGGRLSVSSHDVAWANSDPASGYWSAARQQWIQDYLHIQWLEDPLTWPAINGVTGDPISDGHTAVLYSPHRDGAAGDEVALVAGTGTGDYVWTNTDATVDNIAVRWENGANNGSPDSAVWGGTPTRVVTNCLEWSQIVDGTVRNDILDRTLIWLVGNDHPDVAVSAPDGGESFGGGPVSVSWTETAHGGAAVAQRSLHYSSDGGATWILVTDAAGSSPYSWDISALPNSGNYRVRVSVKDDGSPALRGTDASDADFTIDRQGGDGNGPVVVAGSIQVNPNPIDNRTPAGLSATVTDAGRGDAIIAAAEYSWGSRPLPAGEAFPMTGAFAAVTEGVSQTIPDYRLPVGEQQIWVRAQDANGAWGPATAATFFVNGDAAVGAPDVGLPATFGLAQNAPNPFTTGTTIRFALPQPATVDLSVYNVLGEKVRTLVSGPAAAGHGAYTWDGRNDSGRRVTSGVYFYRLEAGKERSTRKMVILK